MKTYKVEFIENAIANGALKFGQFELKSGRTSPHFFNAGEFYKGSALAALGKCYATAIVEVGGGLLLVPLFVFLVFLSQSQTPMQDLQAAAFVCSQRFFFLANPTNCLAIAATDHLFVLNACRSLDTKKLPVSKIPW